MTINLYEMAASYAEVLVYFICDRNYRDINDHREELRDDLLEVLAVLDQDHEGWPPPVIERLEWIRTRLQAYEAHSQKVRAELSAVRVRPSEKILDTFMRAAGVLVTYAYFDDLDGVDRAAFRNFYEWADLRNQAVFPPEAQETFYKAALELKFINADEYKELMTFVDHEFDIQLRTLLRKKKDAP
jgi:hypothetical protein